MRVLQKHATIKYSSLLNLWLMLKLFYLSSKWTESIITVSVSIVLFQIRIMKQAAWHFICACLISHSHLPPPTFTNCFRVLSMMQARWPDFLQELKLSIHKALRVFVYLFVCPTSVCILSQSVCHHIMSKANSLWAKQASVLQGLEFWRDHRALKFYLLLNLDNHYNRTLLQSDLLTIQLSNNQTLLQSDYLTIQPSSN